MALSARAQGKEHGQKSVNRIFVLLVKLAIQEQEQLADCERVLSFAATLMLQGSQDIRGKIGFAVVGQESYVDVDLNGDEFDDIITVLAPP